VQRNRRYAAPGTAGITTPPDAPVVNYRVVPGGCFSLGILSITLRSPTMIPKRILVPSRLRRPPATGWSWTDGRFVREHMDHLSREAVLLYFFLSAVADVNGLSFYGDGTLSARLRMPLSNLLQARDELLAYDLIAYEPPLTQVLSLPPRCQRRRSEPGGGLMQLGDILRRAIASTHTDQERNEV
jgi:hypothetical protein